MSDVEKRLMDSGVRKPTIVVDWDGTCVPSAWPERPTKWLFGARAALHRFLELGYEVNIHSVRTHSMAFDCSGPNHERDNDIAYIRKMLDDAGLGEVGIVMDDKPPAVFYVDDRAIRYDEGIGGWPTVLAKIEKIHRAGEEAKGDITDVAQDSEEEK